MEIQDTIQCIQDGVPQGLPLPQRVSAPRLEVPLLHRLWWKEFFCELSDVASMEPKLYVF